jgi:hypothetical protein
MPVCVLQFVAALVEFVFVLIGPGLDVQTGSETHSISNRVSNGSFPGVKRPGLSADYPPSPSAEVKERVELY